MQGSKREELQILIDKEDIDIIGITETWGRSEVLDCELELYGYKLFRTDRKDSDTINDKNGSGVALYVKNSLQSVECDELNSKKCEAVWCRIYLNDVDYFITGVCYRSQNVDDCELAQLFDAIKLACDVDHPTLIMGDFNYPEVITIHEVVIRQSDLFVIFVCCTCV